VSPSDPAPGSSSPLADCTLHQNFVFLVSSVFSSRLIEIVYQPIRVSIFIRPLQSTIPEFLARLDKTIVLLESFTPDQINGSEEKTILLPRHDRTSTFTGLEYLTDFVLPNVYFHVTTAYGILRHNGLEIGKTDFLGEVG
jgi:hypothetical protein